MSQPDIPPELAEFGGPPPGFEGFAGGPPPGFDGPPPGVDGAGSPIIDPDRPATSRIPPFVPAPPPDFFFPEMSLAMFGTMLVILQRMLGFYIPALKRATSKTNVLFALAACVLSLVYVLVNLMYLVYGTWLQWGCYPRSYITAILFGLINVSLWAHVIVRSRRAFRAGTAAHLLVYAVFGLFIAGFAGVVIFEIVANLDDKTDTNGVCDYHPGRNIMVLALQLACQIMTIVIFAIPALRIRHMRRLMNETVSGATGSTVTSHFVSTSHTTSRPGGAGQELIAVFSSLLKHGQPHYTPGILKGCALALVLPGLPLFIFGNVLLTALGMPPPDAVFLIASVELLTLAKNAIILETERPDLGSDGLPSERDPGFARARSSSITKGYPGKVAPQPEPAGMELSHGGGPVRMV